MRSRILLAVAALACVLLAGCGGSSDSTEPATAGEGPLTKEKFIAAVDEICAQGNVATQPLEARLEEAGERVDDDPSVENLGEMAELIRQIVSSIEGELAAVRKLEPPAADAENLEETFDLAERGYGLMRELADAIEDLDSSGITEASSELQEVDAEVDGFLRGYGMKVCGADD